MGALAAAGFEMILVFGLVILASIVGLFFGHIILFDSIALALVAGLVANKLLHIHPALSLLIGLGTFGLLFFLQSTKVGFWIIGGLLSLFWAFIFAALTSEITHKDKIWTYVVFGLAFAIMIGLHLKAKAKQG